MLLSELMLLCVMSAPPAATQVAGEKPAATPAPSAEAPAAVLEVNAKLVEIPSAFPPDDLYDYAYVMKYQVQGGPLDKQFLLVAHYKPTVARKKIAGAMKAFVDGSLKRFKLGEVHKLRLEPDVKKVWKGAVVDDFFANDRVSPRYWCLNVDPL